MKAFHAYDIRGIYNEHFNKEDAYKVGFFVPQLLKTQKVLVGRDMRVSSPEIFEYLCKGITDAGADVYNAGLTTTPMVYYATAKYHFDASIQITASHNSKQYNGMKISRTNALPVGMDSGLDKLKSMVEKEPIVVAETKGSIIDFSFIDDYLSFQKSYLKDLSNINIAIDCSNGMASMLIHDILGNAPTYIYDTLDGTFPNHEPNPLIESNCADLMALVQKQHADVGVIFDGDADRVMFIDEKGQFISPDLVIGLMAHYFLEEKGLQGNVLQDIRTSKAVGEYIATFGSKMNMWRVGRAYAALKLREIDGIFGGELAGHYYFRDFFYSDSGILASLIVLGIVSGLKQKGQTLSEAIAAIAKYANSGEINYKIERKQEAMDAVRNYFVSKEKPTAMYDFDGYRVEFPEWWFNIRPSNTEPYLRLLAEARTTTMLQEKLSEIKKIIEQFL